MEWADLALAASRAVHFAAVMSIAGALVFRLLVAPFPLARVLRPSLAVALAGGALWLLLQSGAFAGTTDLKAMLAAVPTVVLRTRFGHTFVIRTVLLLLTVYVTAAACGPSCAWKLYARLPGVSPRKPTVI